MKSHSLYLGICFLLVVHCPLFASDFGVEGIITLPSARMGPDGRFSANFVRSKPVNIFNLTYQATPWLETSFRYSIMNPFELPESKDNNRDRSYEVKARLLREDVFLPEVAIGVRDILGTGVWRGEYLVGSKNIGPLDLSLGLGWGRFSDRGTFRNPLSIISDKFSNRDDVTTSTGGEVRFGSFFRGPVGFFGGLSYQFRNLPIEMLLQYSSDEYRSEVNLGSLQSPGPISYGIKYNFAQGSSVSVSHQQNEYLGINLSFSIDTKSDAKRKPSKKFYSSLSNKNPELKSSQRELKTWYGRMLYDFERSGIRLLNANLETKGKVASLEIENTEYAYAADAINRSLSLANLHLPKRVTNVEVLLREAGLRGPTISYERNNVSHAGGNTRESSTSINQISLSGPKLLADPNKRTKYNYFKLASGLDLSARVQLFDPDEPLRHQIFAKLTGRLIISENLNLWSSYHLDLTNNFSTLRPSSSVLPHVRSDADLYLTRGASGLNALFLENRFSLSSAWHSRAYFGVLEEMFSGLGSEVLFHEYDNRWALGGSVTYVRQRDYEKTFDHLDYNTVTGFLSFYYATPFYDFDVALHAGKYLAGDVGVTVEAKRTFDNGFEIGAFFTKTNVSAEDFGEGSFDKGLLFRIPLNSFSSRNNKTAFSTSLRSINRDGGRRLEDFGATLWNDRRSYRLDALHRTKYRMSP